MTSWPSNWITTALSVAGVESTTATRAIMRAWNQSTPTLPQVNNPVGIPASLASAPSVPGTGYAMFTSMTGFYQAFARFMASQPGRSLKMAMTADSPYPGAWRVIDGLKWPGSLTETDYPSALLDLTSESYRASVNASAPRERKTSGTHKAPESVKATIMAHNKSAANAVATMADAKIAVRQLIRRHASNG